MSKSLPSGEDVDRQSVEGEEANEEGLVSITRKRSRKKPKEVSTTRKRSNCWKNFEVVTVPSSKQLGETDCKAKCKFCHKLYAYKHGGATSHLGRHISSTYPTANIFYPHIVNVKIALISAVVSSDENLKNMGNAMLGKFEKYWAEKNNVMVLATILDPRFKFRYIEWRFQQMYAHPKSEIELQDVRSKLEKLYEKYEMDHRNKNVTSSKGLASSGLSMDTNSSLPLSSSQFESFLQSSSVEPSKSELLIYLDERNESLANKGFNLLEWWKLNAHRFPVVSKMAKNFLNIPASSVSLESTFSAGGRVLDDYRSSLHPTMVEALICTSSWVRGAHNDSKAHKDEDEEDNVENIPFPKSVVESNS